MAPHSVHDPRARRVASLRKLTIGGSTQWILERSDDVENPVLLFVHGGPGTSALTTNRQHTRALEKAFVVVTWDQRGAGKSYAAIKDAAKMNIEQFVQDIRELTLELLQKYRKDRLVLVAHSWGTVISLLAVARFPELFSCYVGIGQMANMAENEAASHKWTLEQARAAGDRKAIDALEKMGTPPYSGDWQSKTITQRRLLGRFGGEVYGSRVGAFGLVMRGVLLSREYTLIDRLNVFRGVLGSMKLLWPELMKVDMLSLVPAVTIPVFFMEGRFDHEVPAENAARYFEALRAPSKKLIWFERSAHMPNWEESERFNEILIEHVRPIAVSAASAQGPDR